MVNDIDSLQKTNSLLKNRINELENENKNIIKNNETEEFEHLNNQNHKLSLE